MLICKLLYLTKMAYNMCMRLSYMAPLPKPALGSKLKEPVNLPTTNAH